MRHHLFVCSAVLLTLFFIGLGISSVKPVYATTYLQETPSLDGIQIYFTEGNLEASRFDRSGNGLSRFAGLLRELGGNLQTLEWRAGFPTDADLVIVAGPLTDFSADQTARLWSYVNNGGKLLLLVDPPRFLGGRIQGMNSQAGLFQLMWYDMGVRVRDDVVLNMAEATLSTATPTSAATETVTSTPAAQAPIDVFTTTEFANDHPVTDGFTEDLAFFTARSLEIDLSVREFPTVPLVFSGADFYGETNLGAFVTTTAATYNIENDTAPSALILAAAFEHPASGTRIVLIGDREFATNGAGLQSSPPNTGSFRYPGNIHFLLNAVTWLLDVDAVAMTFPTPGPTATATLTPTPAAFIADLSVEMTVSNVGPAVNEIIIYDILLTNNGPDTARNVTVTDNLPNGINYILSTTDTDHSYNLETGVWEVDELASGDSAHLLIIVQIGRGTLGSTLTNIVVVTSTGSTDPDPGNNSASATSEVLAFVRQGGD